MQCPIDFAVPQNPVKKLDKQQYIMSASLSGFFFSISERSRGINSQIF
jgi:hypothetical protein